MKTTNKILVIVIIILLFSVELIAQTGIDYTSLKPGNTYTVFIKNGWHTKGVLLEIDSTSLKIKTNYKTYTVLRVDITLIQNSDGAGKTKPIKFGISGGLSLAKAIFDGESTSTRSGFQAGLQIEFYTSSNFSIQPGISYTQRGSTFENEVVLITQKMDYLVFPVNFNYVFNTGKFKPYISAGIYFSKNLNSKHLQEYFSGEEYVFDTKELYNKTDFGWITGAGVNYGLSNSTDLFVNFNYSFGSGNIISTEQTSGFYGEAYNRGIEITCGLKFY